MKPDKAEPLTPEQTIELRRIARECVLPADGGPTFLTQAKYQVWLIGRIAAALLAYGDQRAAEEREECAKLAEDGQVTDGKSLSGHFIAAAIRKRG